MYLSGEIGLLLIPFLRPHLGCFSPQICMPLLSGCSSGVILGGQRRGEIESCRPRVDGYPLPSYPIVFKIAVGPWSSPASVAGMPCGPFIVRPGNCFTFPLLISGRYKVQHPHSGQSPSIWALTPTNSGQLAVAATGSLAKYHASSCSTLCIRCILVQRSWQLRALVKG